MNLKLTRCKRKLNRTKYPVVRIIKSTWFLAELQRIRNRVTLVAALDSPIGQTARSHTLVTNLGWLAILTFNQTRNYVYRAQWCRASCHLPTVDEWNFPCAASQISPWLRDLTRSCTPFPALPCDVLASGRAFPPPSSFWSNKRSRADPRECFTAEPTLCSTVSICRESASTATTTVYPSRYIHFPFLFYRFFESSRGVVTKYLLLFFFATDKNTRETRQSNFFIVVAWFINEEGEGVIRKVEKSFQVYTFSSASRREGVEISVYFKQLRRRAERKMKDLD